MQAQHSRGVGTGRGWNRGSGQGSRSGTPRALRCWALRGAAGPSPEPLSPWALWSHNATTILHLRARSSLWCLSLGTCHLVTCDLRCSPPARRGQDDSSTRVVTSTGKGRTQLQLRPWEMSLCQVAGARLSSARDTSPLSQNPCSKQLMGWVGWGSAGLGRRMQGQSEAWRGREDAGKTRSAGSCAIVKGCGAGGRAPRAVEPFWPSYRHGLPWDVSLRRPSGSSRRGRDAVLVC